MFKLFLPIVLAFSITAASGKANSQPTQSVAIQLQRFLQSEIQAGRIVGAQLRVSEASSQRSLRSNLGLVRAGGGKPVSDETVFCIASCSKPVAASVLFVLMQRGDVKLDQPVTKWIPQLNLQIAHQSIAKRAPTLGELLSHRGGIYSQKKSLSSEQMRAIRDFKLSLDDSVSMIARQSLIGEPGAQYAYSGAGYCLVGKIAESATQKNFESLLQGLLCEPLGMHSTTYFPNEKRFSEIAFGGNSKITFPHRLGDQHQFPLIGGSLYTTADDLERFVKMISNRGRFGGKQIMERDTWRMLVSPTESNQPYGYGWLHTKFNGRVVALSHNGALAPYQSAVRIRLDNKAYAVVMWTLAKPANVQATNQIRNRITSVLKQL